MKIRLKLEFEGEVRLVNSTVTIDIHFQVLLSSTDRYDRDIITFHTKHE